MDDDDDAHEHDQRRLGLIYSHCKHLDQHSYVMWAA